MKKSINVLTPTLIVIICISLVGGLIYFLNSKIVRTYDYNGKSYKSGESFPSKDGCNTCSFNQKGDTICTEMVCTDEQGLTQEDPVDIIFSYSNNAYKYSGTVEKPTPCDKVTVSPSILGPAPELVNLNIDIVSSDKICAQVITKEQISGSIRVSKDAIINIYINESLVKSSANK